MAQYEGNLGERGSFRITATGYATSYGSAGVLRNDDFAAGRIGFYETYDPWQGGDASRFQVSGDLETRAGNTTLKQQIWLVKSSMRLRQNYTGSLPRRAGTPAVPFHAQRGDRSNLTNDAWVLGGRGSARWQTKVLDQNQELEVGYYARYDIVSGSQMRVERATGAPYRVDADYDAKLSDIGLFADLGLRPTSWVTLGGTQANLFGYDVLDKCAVREVAHPPQKVILQATQAASANRTLVATASLSSAPPPRRWL